MLDLVATTPALDDGAAQIACCPATKGQALEAVRAATRDLHQDLERLDAVAHLSDPVRYSILMQRFAALHIPAEAALAPHLVQVEDLDFAGRSRSALLKDHAGAAPFPAFPTPSARAEALGMFYVLEGSTLGGRVILRTLAERGMTGPDLAFFDPYGSETGARWRAFLAILAREVQDDDAIAAACAGAVRAFHHAIRILCGGAA